MDSLWVKYIPIDSLWVKDIPVNSIRLKGSLIAYKYRATSIKSDQSALNNIGFFQQFKHCLYNTTFFLSVNFKVGISSWIILILPKLIHKIYCNFFIMHHVQKSDNELRILWWELQKNSVPIIVWYWEQFYDFYFILF